MSNFGWFVGGCEDEPADLPFAAAEVGVAGTDPNEDTVADFIVGTDAGEEEMGAEASLIEPNVTALAAGTHTLSIRPRVITSAQLYTPDFAVFVGLRAPSLNETPWPNVLGRRECVGCGGP